MNKKIKIAIGCSCAILLSTLSFVYATSSNKTSSADSKMSISQTSITKSENVLKSLNSDSNISKTSIMHDDLENKDYLFLESNNYTVKLESNNNLKGIYSKGITTTKEKSELSKEETEKYVISKYQKLNLPSEYELSYLEKYDDLIWQANFEKNYNGIYNKYESVKMYFIPDTDEIISLTVFNENVSNSEIKLNENDAIQTASEKLNIDSSEIVSASLEMEKANNYYDSSNTDTSIHPTWKVQTKDNSFIFIDANTSSVIGGDEINE